jgi:hypothetical protein
MIVVVVVVVHAVVLLLPFLFLLKNGTLGEIAKTQDFQLLKR